jgi:preprotein translocase subunit SecA
LTQLLKAYSLLKKRCEYVIMDNKIMIVDEQTGRIMDGRRYSDGLHQPSKLKKMQTSTLEHTNLAGMTGTAVTEAGELWTIYKLDVVEIPTNRPMARQQRGFYL